MHMSVQRKIFRIELTNPAAAPKIAFEGTRSPNLQQQEVLTELKALRDLINSRSFPTSDGDTEHVEVSALRRLKDETESIHRAIGRTKQEIAALHVSGAGSERVARELDAVVEWTERATQQILTAAEDIDQSARTLAGLLQSEQETALANGIRDQVIRIFEACNFQDLSGQRISKVLATLKFVEQHVLSMMDIWGGRETFDAIAPPPPEGDSEAKLLNGPKLDDDPGHVSQDDIDALFK
jgi:chemotaxis protein CheZ